MSEQAVKLEELVSMVTDKIVVGKDPSVPYVGLEHLAPGTPDLIGWSRASNSISTNSIFEPGDVLFGKLRPNLRKCIAAPFSGYCSTDLLVLRPSPEYSAGFAVRQLQSEGVFRVAVQTAAGTKMPRTSWKDLRRMRVFAPPLAEQQKIAEILDTVDEAIRKTEQIIAKLKQVKQGLLHDLLTRGIDDNGELRDPERHPEQFKDSPLGRIPKAWEVATLGELLSDAYRYPTYHGIEYAASGVPEIRGALLNGDGTISGDFRYISESTALRFPRVRLRENDFVMSVRGTLGKVGRIPACLTGAVITANLIKLTFADGVDHGWMSSFLLSSAFQKSLEFASSATTIATIQVPALAGICLALPSTAEQSQIADVVSQFQRRLDVEIEKLDKLRLLKQGLMEDLLTGKVRVTNLLE